VLRISTRDSQAAIPKVLLDKWKKEQQAKSPEYISFSNRKEVWDYIRNIFQSRDVTFITNDNKGVKRQIQSMWWEGIGIKIDTKEMVLLWSFEDWNNLKLRQDENGDIHYNVRFNT